MTVSAIETQPQPPLWKTLTAFAIIYVVWGSTFLAIRIGVAEVPPFLFAAMRFFTAGLVLYLWQIFRGEPNPTHREWASITLLASLIFVLDYGLLFWTEQRVPSGLAAVMLATIPVFIALFEILILRTQRLTPQLIAALIIGLAGVAVLMSPGLPLSGAPIAKAGAIALLIAAIGWSIGTVLTRKLPLPKSKSMSSGTQMLVGGVLLALVSGVAGEFHNFHPAAVSRAAWLSLLYLIVAGSLIGFTAYVWLIHHQSPTKVGTYAYVNPVIAVLLGYFLANEPLGMRTILGTLCVLISVIVITTTRAEKTALPSASEPRR